MAQTSFFGLRLQTAPGDVMTPRPATERLVAAATARIRGRARVADVGTGSGAIAVALALAAPAAEIWATDVSPAAVMLTRVNARLHGVDDRVHALRGDLLAPVPEQLDLIVANLPYLRRDEQCRYAELANEPEDAVFADGDGLGPYRRLLDEAAGKLAPGGAAVIQLHKHVLVAERDRLEELAAMLRAA